RKRTEEDGRGRKRTEEDGRGRKRDGEEHRARLRGFYLLRDLSIARPLPCVVKRSGGGIPGGGTLSHQDAAARMAGPLDIRQTRTCRRAPTRALRARPPALRRGGDRKAALASCLRLLGHQEVPIPPLVPERAIQPLRRVVPAIDFQMQRANTESCGFFACCA